MNKDKNPSGTQDFKKNDNLQRQKVVTPDFSVMLTPGKQCSHSYNLDGKDCESNHLVTG